MVDYAHPEVLVSTEWVAAHLHDSEVRLIEVDVDTTAYDSGHLEGAVGWNWQSQLPAGMAGARLCCSVCSMLRPRPPYAP